MDSRAPFGQFILYTNILIGKRRVEDSSSMYNFSFICHSLKKSPQAFLPKSLAL